MNSEKYFGFGYFNDPTSQSSEEKDVVDTETGNHRQPQGYQEDSPSQENLNNPPMSDDNTDKDSVVVNSPEFLGGEDRREDWNRKAELRKNTADELQRDVFMKFANTDQVQIRVPKPEEPVENKSNLKKPIGEMKKEAPAGSDTVQAKVTELTGEKVIAAPETKGFFYQHAHRIPQPVERIDEEFPQDKEPISYDKESISAKANVLGSIPIAAVHDAQMSPFQRLLLPNYHLKPIFIPPVRS